jgi:hypothetical protein
MGFFSRKPWDMAKTVDFARAMKATGITLQVGEPVLIATPGGERRIAGFPWKQADYDERILARLDTFARETVSSTGRCDWAFEKDGVGKVAGEVGSSKTTLKLL